MLRLIDIKKDYVTGDTTVNALKGVSLEFRQSEFVSILGQSGCGKTTLLNIIGGLDQYSSGDLIINGKSTKEFKDRDWDTYRNHSIGFIFQSYNLIPHQTVLANVELALTLSGVSREERRKRAIEALETVGLGEQIKKKPNQLSGGQMQRVAIARALVNNPEILLADEPTGALDSETSVQIMELLKAISHDKLIIMVTHNPELAEQYSTRIINLLDGNVVNDSNPYHSHLEDGEKEKTAAPVDENESLPLTKEEIKERKRALREKKKKERLEHKKTSMSFTTAFLLSLKNLLTKKGRTILTSFAGSIGIIGIALIFAVSNGLNSYINHVQETTLSSYPLTLTAETVDMSELIGTILGGGEQNEGENENREDGKLYKDQLIAELVEALSKTEVNENDLESFKTYLEGELANPESELGKAVSAVQYAYNINLTVYTKNKDGKIIKSDTSELMMEMLADYFMKINMAGPGGNTQEQGQPSTGNTMGSNLMMSSGMWQEMLPGVKENSVISDVLTSQYDLVYGQWPNEFDEIVLVVDQENELDDLTLYALGLLSKEHIDAIIDAAASGKPLEEKEEWSYDFKDICYDGTSNGLTFKVILPANCYQKIGDVYVDASSNEALLSSLYNNALELKVSGIIRLKDTVDQGMMKGAIGYTSLLTKHIISEAVNSEVVKAQLANPGIDVLTGKPFDSTTDSMTTEEKATYLKNYVSNMSTKEKAEMFFKMTCLDTYDEQLESLVELTMSQMTDKNVLIMQISQIIAEQMNSSPEEISAFFADFTLDQLKQLIRPTIEEATKAQLDQSVKQFLDTAIPTEEGRAASLDTKIAACTQEQCAHYYDNVIEFSESSYEENLELFGNVDVNSPSSINLYTSTFEDKDTIKNAIDNIYNPSVDESKRISYTDYIGLMMSGITTIINAITYVLVAFVATSLVVSSIMIGVITLISVQERTKEIGVLRAMGASKKDISRVFNAETMIVGFVSGAIGILITLVLEAIINIILFALTEIVGLKASLGFGPAIALVIISMLLTLVAGLIPSRVAAKKDPVVALRTE
ncbi:MAG: ABC transporter ATP-binding protein/permease [Ruminococcaceae bacterium]|nr:ABC transporter ATP-binding protein/permease [Oscillospiraceae bacterium]